MPAPRMLTRPSAHDARVSRTSLPDGSEATARFTSRPRHARPLFSALAVVTLLVALLAPRAWSQEYAASLRGSNEVPPNASPGLGVGSFTLDAANLLHYNITFGGLVGAENAASIHRGAAGTVGGALYPLPLGSPKVGVLGPLKAAEIAALDAGELYVNIFTRDFQGGEIRGQIYPIERDYFPTTHAVITLQGPFGAETVQLDGPTTVLVYINELADTDNNGLEQVRTEMTQLDLSGVSSMIGPIQVHLRSPAKHPFKTSRGEIEETANTQTGRLDLPPFAPSGTANSFFDVFFEVQAAGQTLHGHLPKHMQTIIDHKPPGPGNTYQGPEIITLFDENENQTPFAIGPCQHTPNTMEHDYFPNTIADLELSGIVNETLSVQGPTAVDVNLGALGDPDFNGLEQVPTEMVQLNLTGVSPNLGPVVVRLRSPNLSPGMHTLGEIEETANTQAGRLDLPPFAPSGTANSFFDVFFEIQLPATGMVLHNMQPKHMQTLIHHKPPGPGDTYQNPDLTPLYDENNNPVGIYVGPTNHTPDAIEVDHFPFSHAVVEISGPTGVIPVALTGPTTVNVDMGHVADTDFNGLEQVTTEMVQLQLTGVSPLVGPVSLTLRDPLKHPFMHTLGGIEENANTMVGRLDLPPFAPTGTASSFFDVFFEVQIDALGLLLHNDIPKHMQSVIHHKPPGPGEWYEDPTPIPLVDERDQPTPFVILRTRHLPDTDTLTVAVGPPVLPSRVAIQAVRPNPARASATVSYGLPAGGQVDLAIYDLSGRLVRRLVNEVVEAGVQSVTWDGRNRAGEEASEGVYFVRLVNGTALSARRFVLLR